MYLVWIIKHTILYCHPFYVVYAHTNTNPLPSLSPPEGSSYFFKGKEYWRVPGSDMEVEASFPRLIAKDWLLCTEMQSDSPDTEPKSTETGGNVHHHSDHAENGFEVCSCTSDTASPLGARPSPSPMWLLPPLWTLSLAFRSEPLWCQSRGQSSWADWWRASGHSAEELEHFVLTISFGNLLR